MQLGLTAEQRAARRYGIGGSDAGKIMAGDWLPLWQEKTGRAEPADLSRVLPVQIGLITEPLNLYWFARETGYQVFARGDVYTHPDYSFIRCTLDGLTLIDGSPAIVQAKHVNAFAKIDEIEARYYPQVAHEMLVTGAQRGFLTVFVGTLKWECIEFHRDREYTRELLEREREFWDWVVRDEPPPSDHAPVAMPAKPTVLREVDFSTHNEWTMLAVDWLETRPAAQRNDKAAKGLRGLVEADVGRAWGSGVEIRRSRDGRLLLGALK